MRHGGEDQWYEESLVNMSHMTHRHSKVALVAYTRKEWPLTRNIIPDPKLWIGVNCLVILEIVVDSCLEPIYASAKQLRLSFFG